MSSRGIRAIRSLFTAPITELLIPPQGIIKFTHVPNTYYKKLMIDGHISYINEILLAEDMSTLQINTSSATYNNFLIHWAVCIKTASSSNMPCFSIVVRNEDNSIFTSLPSNAVRRTTVVYGHTLLHLPTPPPEIPQVSYYLNIVNTTGADCFYSTKAIYIAEILITCIDDN